MADLEEHRRDWEDLARLDPHWAVVSDPSRRFGGWDDAEFFATGEEEAGLVLQRAEPLGLPREHGSALEFGCGLGRVTRALASRYERVVGIDISEEMLRRARELNAGQANIDFVHNTTADLAVVGDQRFDLVYTRHVLQHLPSVDIARRYVQEMVRVLRPGGLVLAHLPLEIPLRNRLMLTRRLHNGLRRAGVPEDVLYRRLKLHPISMLAVPEAEVRRWFEEAGGRVVHVETKRGQVLSGDVYATRDRAAS